MGEGTFDLNVYQMGVYLDPNHLGPTPLTVRLSKHLNYLHMASHTLGQFSIHLVS